MFSELKPAIVHIQVTIETVQQHHVAKCVRLSEPPVGDYKVHRAVFGVYRWGETSDSGWTPAINHTTILYAQLYWQPSDYAEELVDKVGRKLEGYIKRLLDADPGLRESIYRQLKGTGWYFGKQLIK